MSSARRKRVATRDRYFQSVCASRNRKWVVPPILACQTGATDMEIEPWRVQELDPRATGYGQVISAGVLRQGSMSPARMAYLVSSVRSRMPSFCRMLARCRSTVFRLMTRVSAMSLEE